MPHHKVIREFAAASVRPRRKAASGSSEGVVSYTTPRQSKYPPWTQLPYLILLEIFRYASTDYSKCLSHPDKVDHGWLYTTALTCKSFSEPALDLLYESPPIDSVPRLRKLTEALTANPLLGKKIRRLRGGVADILDAKLIKFKFEDIVRLCPNLREVHLSDPSWVGPVPFIATRARSLEMSANVPVAMDETGIELKSWAWGEDMSQSIAAQFDPRFENQKKMPRSNRGFAWMDFVHKNFKCYKTLTSLTLEKFEYPAPEWEYPEQPDSEMKSVIDIATLAGAIDSLKYLKDLLLRSSNFVNGYFLTQIAGDHQLKRMVLDDLRYLEGDGLMKFLELGGKQLQELEVTRCAGVRMGFLSVLETSTPNLRRLLFEDVPDTLDSEEITSYQLAAPTWPSTLESLVMRSLGNFRAEQCEAFLQGLVDTVSYGGLMALREIDVWCILPQLGWRDRAAMRRKWSSEFGKAFLDRRGNAWKEFVQKKRNEGEKIQDDGNVTAALCQTVLFRVDDSRPTDNQLREEDFLDLDTRKSSGKAKRAPKSSTSRNAGKSPAKASSSKSSAAKTKATAAKRKAAASAQSFVVGRKRPRYNSDEDGDFEADQLAYDDEDGEDSSWSFDEND